MSVAEKWKVEYGVFTPSQTLFTAVDHVGDVDVTSLF
jgi:hypothetical protein